MTVMNNNELDLREEFVLRIKQIMKNGVQMKNFAPSIGINQQTISNWFAGKSKPKMNFARFHWEHVNETLEKSKDLRNFLKKKD